jgi:hypothetical protein
MVTLREMAYFPGIRSAGGARQVWFLCTILPQEVQYMSNLSYMKEI